MHGAAGPPALVAHVEHLHGAQVLVAVVAAHREDQPRSLARIWPHRGAMALLGALGGVKRAS